MTWELGTTLFLFGLLFMHWWFHKIYTCRIRHLDDNIGEMIEIDDGKDDYTSDALSDLVRMKAQAKVDKDSNLRHAIVVHSICATGSLFLALWSLINITATAGWLFTLVVIPPMVLFLHHMQNVWVSRVKRRGVL